jgi:hypothetical protein
MLKPMDADCHRQKQVLELASGLVLLQVQRGSLDRVWPMVQLSPKELLSQPKSWVLLQRTLVLRRQIWPPVRLSLLLRCQQTH